jgi:zinc transporter, ZIP family
MLSMEGKMESVFLGSTLSALSTGLGALPILFLNKVTHRWRDILLAFTAGIMVSASTFSLIPEAILQGSLTSLTVGLFLGVFILNALEKVIPHIELEQQTTTNVAIDRKALLVIAAITLHNLPEGLSVGVSYASDQAEIGNLIAFAIGLQNVPEGFLVALFLFNQNINRWKALAIATLTGSVEIISAWLGYSLAAVVENIVPFGLSFAAGSMLFIVYKELIPESHGDGNERAATYSFIAGLLVMIYLTQLL